MNTVPHQRDKREVQALLRAFAAQRRVQRSAGIVAGVVAFNWKSGGFDIHIEAVDFPPAYWVALADAALEHAAKRMAAAPHIWGEKILVVEQARAILDFEETRADA